MERLTEWLGAANDRCAMPNSEVCRIGQRHDWEQMAINKLAQYEDLEEQGLLVRLPCKVGDKIWYIERDEDGDAIDVSGVMFLSVAGDSVIGTAQINDYTDIAEHLQYHIQKTYEDFGTELFVLPLMDCFLTREEAEAALRKMGGDKSE